MACSSASRFEEERSPEGNGTMNGLQFTSTLVGDLSWPIVVSAAIIIFRKPIAEVIGRVRSYEGLGQKLTFGDRLENAEQSVDAAAKNAEIERGGGEGQKKVDLSPLAREAEANPSFVVIQSWEQLSGALDDLIGAASPGRRPGPSVSLLPGLQKQGLVDDKFVTAVRELRDLRNLVAHGRHNPTPGEAVAYADSVQTLATTARLRASDLTTKRREAEIDNLQTSGA